VQIKNIRVMPPINTSRNKVQVLHVLRNFGILFLFFMLYSCSVDTDITEEPEKNIVEEISGTSTVYKGIFATQNSKFRGIFELKLPRGKGDLNELNKAAFGTITMQTGEVFEAQADKLIQKSADFKLVFESEDLTFTFSLDKNNNPLITDVVFQGQSAAILAAQETEDSPVTPVTGTYVCTNCQDQNSSISGIELNNEKRTFNMLLTTADGNTNISIQALVGILVDTQLLVNESCTSNEEYTFCVIKSGENLTTEPIKWTGVHRYTAEGSESTRCSGISGVFEYTSSDFGSIKGEFNSDKTCPNKTYFVSPRGNDTNTGISPQDPWQSISKINSIDLKPGDIVLFEGNNEYSGNIYLDNKDGNNSANPIKISSYGTGKATIKAGSSFGIYAYNTSGITIDNLIIAGNGINTNTHSGIYFYNDLPGNVKLDFIEITNSEVYGFKDFGIVIGAQNENSGFSNVLIENNKVHDILDVGISSYGKFSSTKTGYAHSNITVRNCEVYKIKGYSKNSHSGDGIVLSDVQNSTIEHCTVYDSGSGNTNCGGPVGIWYWDADQVTIQFCEAYNISSGSGCDGGGFDMDGGVTNGVMQYNYSHDNDGSGFLAGQFIGARPMQNIIIRFNISENDAGTNGGSVNLFNGQNSLSIKDIYVYNNTFYLSEQATNTNSATVKYTLWKPVNNNINFYNNILFAENGADLIDAPSGYEGNFAGNLYYTSGIFRINYNGNTYNSLENFRGTGNETFENLPVGYQGKPMLTSPGDGGIIGFDNKLSSLGAYKLKADSPALNAGINFYLDRGTRDFYGSNLTQTSSNDIGAHEKN